jgi:hypothetical protein
MTRLSWLFCTRVLRVGGCQNPWLAKESRRRPAFGGWLGDDDIWGEDIASLFLSLSREKQVPTLQAVDCVFVAELPHARVPAKQIKLSKGADSNFFMNLRHCMELRAEELGGLRTESSYAPHAEKAISRHNP